MRRDIPLLKLFLLHKESHFEVEAFLGVSLVEDEGLGLVEIFQVCTSNNNKKKKMSLVYEIDCT